ncbi:MAG: hypothetical protein IKW13_01565 [Thermoguttaceae bacterium]|nr:hypothetical protein [Thermoguttaceae bacterium]
MGRVFTKEPEQWEKYSRYGVARVPARFIDEDRLKRLGAHWNPRLETGKVEPFLTVDGLFRAFAASRSYFGATARGRFLKSQEEGDLKRLAKAAFKLLAEREAEIKRLAGQARNDDGPDD